MRLDPIVADGGARVSGARGRVARLRRALRAPLGEQLEGALERQLLDVVAARRLAFVSPSVT